MTQVIIKKFSPKTHKIKAVIYGGSGSWKTSFWGSAPKPIFASAEGWLLSIQHLGPEYVDIKSIEDLASLLTYLKTQKHDYQTIVIDSITEISEIIKADIQRRSGKQMEQRDWGVLSKKIRDILVGFRNLDMHVLFIAQEKYEKDESTIIKIFPSLNGKSADEIAYFMDIVGYLNIDPSTNERKILTMTNQKYVTKDRTRMIGNDTTCDFSAWVEAVKGLEVVKEDQVVYDENLENNWEIETNEVIKKNPTPSTSTVAKTAPQARKAPENDASEAQRKLLSSLIGELTAKIADDGDKLLKVIHKTILTITGVDVGVDNGTVDEMLLKLKASHASILIEYLKERLAKAKAEKEGKTAEVPTETPPVVEKPLEKKETPKVEEKTTNSVGPTPEEIQEEKARNDQQASMADSDHEAEMQALAEQEAWQHAEQEQANQNADLPY